MPILEPNYSASHRAQVAEYRRHGYLANGWNRVRRWNGRTPVLELAGIEGPSPVAGSWAPTPTTAAGTSTVGVHTFRYRYMDSRTGYVSNPSAEFEAEILAGNEALTFAIDDAGADKIVRSTDVKVDTIVLEMTVAGDGAEFYEVAQARQTEASIGANLADELLEQNQLPYEDDGHDPPPLSKNIVSHKDRLWLFSQTVHRTGTVDLTFNSVHVDAGATDPDWLEEALGSASGESDGVWFFQREGEDTSYQIDYFDEPGARLVLKEAYQGISAADVSYRIFSRVNSIWVSEPGFPEGFVPLKSINGPNGEGAGDLTAGVGYANSMIFFSQAAMFKFTFDAGPHEDGFYTPLSNLAGALNQRVVIEVEGSVYTMDRRGWHVWQGVFPQQISRPIDPYRDEIDYSKADRFHCCWFPEIRAIRWFVCYTGDSYPKHYFQLDVDSGAWSTGEYLQGISESRLVPINGQRRVLYGDENGHVWFADTGTADGVDGPTLSHLTVTGGSSDTVVIVSEVLPTANEGIKGAYLHQRYADGTGESRLITANAQHSITVNPPFTQAAAVDDVVWVGPIPTKLKTRAFMADGILGARRVTKENYLGLVFTPTSQARLLQLRVYENLSATAKRWATRPRRIVGTYYPGEDLRFPLTDWLIRLETPEGYTEVNMGSEFRRFREVELEILEPDADFRLVLIDRDGVSVADEGS